MWATDDGLHGAVRKKPTLFIPASSRRTDRKELNCAEINTRRASFEGSTNRYFSVILRCYIMFLFPAALRLAFGKVGCGGKYQKNEYSTVSGKVRSLSDVIFTFKIKKLTYQKYLHGTRHRASSSCYRLGNIEIEDEPIPHRRASSTPPCDGGGVDVPSPPPPAYQWNS